METYKDLLRRITEQGEKHGEFIREERTLMLFGEQLRYNLSERFPVTVLSMDDIRGLLAETLWFVKDLKNPEYLHKYGVYSKDRLFEDRSDLTDLTANLWRRWPGGDGRSVDQIKNLVSQIKYNPNSRRMLISLWEPSIVNYMDAPPCSVMAHFMVYNGALHCKYYQRGANILKRVPESLCMYGALTCLLAKHCSLIPGELIWSVGDVHLYFKDIEKAKEILAQEERSIFRLNLKTKANHLSDYEVEDFELLEYPIS